MCVDEDIIRRKGEDDSLLVVLLGIAGLVFMCREEGMKQEKKLPARNQGVQKKIHPMPGLVYQHL